jgi:heme/copper-type cytochrome/quinol oxidase subunit 2
LGGNFPFEKGLLKALRCLTLVRVDRPLSRVFHPLWQPRTDLAARLLGVGFFFIGVALLGYQANVLIREVSAHAEQVDYFMSAIALGLMGIMLGLYWMVRGLAGYTSVRTLQTHPRRLRILSAVAAVILIAIVAALKMWLTSHGYS